MKIILAKSAGFCFGVDRALKKVYDDLGKQPLYTYGPIIHNRQVVEELAEKNVNVIDDLKELKTVERGSIVIRSHGIGREEQEIISKSGFKIIEATCPYVKRIHSLVQEAANQGHHIIIVGNANHPEVRGISGWSSQPVYIIETVEEIDTVQFKDDVTYEVVAQTTYNYNQYIDILNRLQNLNIRVIINKTICKATEVRQKEAIEIAKEVDIMIVIGGKHSSNTKKLYEICKGQCEETYHIESIEEFELNVLRSDSVVGITAGASTPKKLIEEVISNVRNAERTEL